MSSAETTLGTDLRRAGIEPWAWVDKQQRGGHTMLVDHWRAAVCPSRDGAAAPGDGG